MTDKATVELPAPVAGTVVAINGEVGEKRAGRLGAGGAGGGGAKVAAEHVEAAPSPGRR